MVPEGWKKKRICEIAHIQVGRDLKEENYSDFMTDRHIYPVYSNTVEQRGLYGYYDFAEYPGGSVTVVGRGVGLGTAFARYENEGFGAIGRLLVLSPRDNLFDVGYFADYINFSLRIYNESGGIPQLPGASLAKYFALLPPLQEQKKISKILSTWDRAIEVTEKLIANSQQQKKALMQQLLTGKKRLVGFSEGWETVRLEELYSFKKGKRLSKGLMSKSGGNKCILYGELYTRYKEVIHQVHNRTDSTDGLLSISGDVLIPSSTTTSGIDLANATALLESNVLLGGDINVLRPLNNNVDANFIAHLLTHVKKHEIASRAQGITIIHLYGSDLKGLIISLPKALKEQQKIASVLSAADKEIETLKQKLECLRQEKKALMQQLLTGKRRVKIDEEDVPQKEVVRA